MAKLAQGTKILMGDGQPSETFTEIPDLGDIDYSPPEPEQEDVTNHDSGDREYLPGLGADGEVTSEVHFDASKPMHLSLWDKHGLPDATNFKIVWPDTASTTVTLAAFVTITQQMPVGKAAKMPFTLKVTGKPVRT